MNSLRRLRAISNQFSSSSPVISRSSSLVRTMTSSASASKKLELSEKEWKDKLTPAEYAVLRNKGTEAPSKGEYDKFYPTEGYFACRGCGNPLYSAKAKFDSGCGWPAFDKCFKGAIETHVDGSMFMKRIEIVCAKCGGHQGHVFENEGFTETNERHCVNSVSVKFIKGPLPEDVANLGEAKVMDK